MIENEFLVNKIVNLYPGLGLGDCAQEVQASAEYVRKIARKYKLKVNEEGLKRVYYRAGLKRNKKEKEFKVNPVFFIREFIPESVYLIGLIWADGYLIDDNIRIEMVSEDLSNIEYIFDKTGVWAKSHRSRKKRKKQSLYSTNNKMIANFLRKNGFKSRRDTSPDSLLSQIPEKLHHYFFRGLSDGDGCWYVSKNKSYQFSYSGRYSQDWHFVLNIFNKLGIRSRVEKRFLKKTNYRCSLIRISNKPGCIAFGNYIYQGESFGLTRKYEKYLSLLA